MTSIAATVLVAALLGEEQDAKAPPSPAEACAALARLALPQASVASARIVSGDFLPPAGLAPWLAGDPALYKTLPGFCRVALVAAPSAGSAIEIEVWMPAEGWNGRFRGQGNGGFAGEIHYRAMATAVRQGYATAGTNTGHSGVATDASWALGHPEKVADFGYRAIHAMTEHAKSAIRGFYGRDARRAYFVGCSNGGRQALMEVQRFPADYDGVLAGAPANNWSRMLAKGLADAQATTGDAYIPPSKIPALARAVAAACDAADGLTDDILGDPPSCRFDPASLSCRGADSESCLTAPQVAALRAVYEGPRDSKAVRIFPGIVPGAETGPGGWGLWVTGPAQGKSLTFAFQSGYFANMVYEKADWDYRTANVEQALAASQEKTRHLLDATDPDLSAFKARGGKLVVYHGWNDAAISAWNTLDYHQSVVARMGRQETEAFVRLYMVPGMQHCDGGTGPDSFGQHGNGPPDDPRRNVLLALEKWVEEGKAPSALLGTRNDDGDPARGTRLRRPLCPHPEVARYKGKGDPTDAASFACAP
jgi:feruloyl esterase